MTELFIYMIKFSKYALFILLFLAITSIALYSIKTPSNHRQWSSEQETKTTITIDDQKNVSIKNMRDFDWLQEQRSNQENYRNVQFNLSELTSLKVAVSHFSVISELAHVFLMFELNNNVQFGFSIEARREKGEEYSLLGGLLARYELIYLIASEDDLLGIRKSRNEKIYLYPIKTTPEKVQDLFRIVADKTNEIDQKPEFYHLFLKNCTTLTVDLVGQISDHNYSKLIPAFMPGNTGKALFKMGLIETNENSFKNVQKASLEK